MLELSGLAAALGLAGCMGDGGNGGDGTTTPGTTADDTTDGGTTTNEEEYAHVDGQTFRVPLFENPNDFYWFWNDMGSYQYTDDFDVNTTETIGQLTYEQGIWGAWIHAAYSRQGDARPRTVEVVETSDDRFEFTIRDDFTWSNGDPVTSRDAVAPLIGERLTAAAMPIERVNEHGPAEERDAITGFELPDDRTAVLHSEGGHFGTFITQNLWSELLVEQGPKYPTRGVEPYEAYVDALFDTWDQYKNGEVDPWNSESDEHFRPGIQVEVYGGQEGYEQYREKFSDPANVVTNGAWQVDEILQNEIVFTPNEHHRNADRINFDEIRAERMDNENLVYTSLNAGRIDFAAVNPPSHLLDEFPDTYETLTIREKEGEVVMLNHNWPGLRKVGGRQALQHALDTPSLCETVNPERWEPIQVPAGDVPYVQEYLPEGWAEENLIDYSYDPETATRKMEEAGFTKPNDTWLDENGDPIELVFHSEAESMTLETAVVDQLKDFGIEAQVRPMDHAQFENAKKPNDLCIWPEAYGAGFPLWVAQTYSRGWFQDFGAYALRWFPKEQLDRTEYLDNTLAANRNPEDVRHLTTMAPPVGEPDGELQEYETMHMTLRLPYLTGDELTETMQKLFWLVNWHVPSWPVANTSEARYLNTENWHWPQDAEHWQYLGNGSVPFPELHGWGDQIFADPENPKPQ